MTAGGAPLGAVRAAAVAGAFYPGRAAEVEAVVEGLLAGARVGSRAAGGQPVEPLEGPLRAIVVPHAGWAYSGPIAATAFALLEGLDPPPPRLALLGPSHFVPLAGAAVPSHTAWETPLGRTAIDDELRRAALAAGAVVDDAVHRREHSLEVQLPFLQRVCPSASLLPVAVGDVGHGAVADLVDALTGVPGTLVVVSTDLSHYHDAETARRLDRRSADAVLARQPEAIAVEDACGVFALRGIVSWARRHDLRVRLLDLRCSADTAGDPWRVVGYGAFAITG